MAKDSDKKEEKPVNDKGVISRGISLEMKEAYLDYAMSVITARALPDVRDGLKPVHRRILYSMAEMGLTASAKFRKSATVIGHVLGSYHPHGDVAAYDAMAKMAQDFSFRYPLVIGQGNFGCFTKDTEVRLADGRNLSFEDLVKEHKSGKKNYTFTVNDKGAIEIAPIINPRMTKAKAEIIKVVLDNGEEIRCTPDHRFMLRDGNYKEAQSLKKNTSLMPLYTRLSTNTDSNTSEMLGYEMILDTQTNKWVFAHHLADIYNVKNGKYDVSFGRVRHHIDFKKLNNNPDNIIRMKWLDHWKLHSNLVSSRHKNDPEYVRKLKEGRDRFWSNPENKLNYSKRLSQKNKENWENPIYKERMSRFLSESTTAYIQNHPEKRLELSKRATKTLKRLWKDPEYQQFIHERIIKGNKNHTTNRTGKIKFDKICRVVFEKNQQLSKETYNQARKEVYSYKRATSWETGLYNYYSGNVGRVAVEIQHNHKVRDIEILNTLEDVYDLTVNGTHNFALAAGVFVHNSIDGDSPAAYRYTEAKMSKISADMLRDLNKNTVDFRPNYDGTKKEPIVLPSLAPNLLLNGTLGIAVGMATNIPPHNLGEVVDAVVHLIDNEKATTEDLLEFVKGPDFPMGAVVYGKSDIYHAYASGRGPMLVRGEAEIVENKAGQFQIIVTSIPYRVNKANVIVKIAELVQTKRIEGIKDIRDESTKDIRVVIDLKTGAHPNKILNALYKHTQLEDTFHLNMVALVDGVPQTLSLKSTLEEFIKHRKEVVTRRTRFELEKAEAREHILLGLKKALDHIDEIIKIIKASKDTAEAHANLMKKFKFSILQTTAILEMKLQRLAGLERKKIEDELKEIQKLITELKALLASVIKIKNKVKEELMELRAVHADDRRTKVVARKAKDISDEDLIPDEDSVLVFTSGGYVKRTNPDEYKKQKRGGVGVVDLNTKEEDFVTSLITTTLHSDLLFFTDKGKVYGLKMYDVPEGRRATRGKSIANFLALGADENITSILPMPKDMKKDEVSLLMVTKEGIAKKVDTTSFHDVRRSGLIAITLKGNDKLVSTSFVNKTDEVIVVTENGQSIRFKEDDIREMGRSAAGVRAIKLSKGDTVISSIVINELNKKGYVLVISANGYGKKTSLKEYKIQNRGGSGIKTGKVTSKTGKLISAKILSGEDEEIVSMSKKSQVIRLDSNEIPSLGRQTQGVRIMKLKAGDSIASLILV